ncbi:MAG TPA: DEAD/DEAH box helicase family protein, partial [Pirellulaceae bacterium]
MFALRDYQTRIIDETRAALRDHTSVLIQSATGSGKTNLATYMIGRAAERGKRAWFVCHRDFLLTQTAATFDSIGVNYGFIAAGREFNPHR